MEKEEKSEGQRRLSKSAFCSRYQEKELATRENVAMQNLEILTYRGEIIIEKFNFYQCRS